MGGISWIVAFTGGLASFLSPCIVPLVPSYLSTLAGTALTGDGDANPQRGRVMAHALAFIGGFTVLLVLSGMAATTLGSAIRQHQHVLAELGGVVMVIFGLELLGVIHLGLLNRTVQLRAPRQRATLAGAFVLGLVFAAGWTPCVGPILASILILAARAQSVAMGGLLLLSYALGLAVPFVAAALLLDRVITLTRRIGPWLPWIERMAGGLLAILGISLITGWYSRIPGLL
jgi:cytochrome c-type biogenesis protein